MTPKTVFVVPYRNRVQQKFFFSKYMTFLLEAKDDYEIYFSHQCDARSFNRGASKNIGFLAVRAAYPDHYKDINFVFNDVDTVPFHKIFNYETKRGQVKHFYGFKYALGGIVVMKGADFEQINGFPCYWGWGMEDNVLQSRCLANKLNIDRSVFYPIGSPQILQLFDGVNRLINKKDTWRQEKDNGNDGLTSVRNLSYTIDDKSACPGDNAFVVVNPRIHVINVKSFDVYTPFTNDQLYNYDLRESNKMFHNPSNKSIVHADWTNAFR